MSNFYGGQPPNYGGGGGAGAGAQNLQFYPSTYSPGVSGGAAPQQSAYGYNAGGGAPAGGYGGAPAGGQAGFAQPGFGGVSGRMGEQGGLRTGWIAAFSTEGYDGEPSLIEEIGINPKHIQAKVRQHLPQLTRYLQA
jgi:hypothetical protein